MNGHEHEAERGYQAELWCKLTSDLHEYGRIDRLCETPRMTELEALYENMTTNLMSTLNAEQEAALNGLLDIAYGLRWNSHESGVTLGLQIAKELKSFLEHPMDALRQANAAYLPVGIAYGHSVEKIAALSAQDKPAEQGS